MQKVKPAETKALKKQLNQKLKFFIIAVFILLLIVFSALFTIFLLNQINTSKQKPSSQIDRLKIMNRVDPEGAPTRTSESEREKLINRTDNTTKAVTISEQEKMKILERTDQ